MAGDDDVLDPVVVDQRLQPPQPEQGVEDRLRDSVLLRHRPRPVAGGQVLLGLGLQQVKDDGAAQLLLSLPVQMARLLAQRSAQPLRRLRPQPRHQRPVHPDAPPATGRRLTPAPAAPS